MLPDVSRIDASSLMVHSGVFSQQQQDSTVVAPVRAPCINYFATLHQDILASSQHGAGQQHERYATTSALDSSTTSVHHGGNASHTERRPFVDAPSSTLPAHKLKELCLRTLAHRMGGSSHDGGEHKPHATLLRDNVSEDRSYGHTRRELRRKLRAGVSAVIFSSLLTHMRLKSITKNLESHLCEPYRVLPTAQDLYVTCGRAVCIFAAQQSVHEGLLYFALDRCLLPAEGWEWQIFRVRVEDASMLVAQFAGCQASQEDGSGDGARSLKHGLIRLCDPVVIAEYDEHQRLLIPVSVEHMRGRTNTYLQILRDFEQKVNSVTISASNEGVSEPPSEGVEGRRGRRGGASVSLSSFQRNDHRNAPSTSSSPSSLPIVPIDQSFNDEAAASAAQTMSFLDIPLPTFQELSVMPLEVRIAVQELALGVLRRCFFPRVLLRQRKKLRERMSRGATIFPLSVDQLLKLQTFEMWPPSLLDELIQCLKPYAVDRGEIILQEKECPCTAVYFLTSGTVQQLQKLDRTNKKVCPSNSRVLQGSITGISCFGQLSFISADPRMTTIRAVTPCSFWRLFRPEYFRVFSKLPVSVRMHVQDVAFQRRTQSVPYNEPLTVSVLRSMPVFSTCGEGALRALLPLFRPMSVPPGHELSTADHDGVSMYILLRGRCGVFRHLKDRKEDAHVQSIAPPTMIGDDAVIGGGSHVATIRTLVSSDLYCITKEEFEGCMTRYGGDWNLVVDQATKARHLRLLDSQDRFKEMAVNIPLVASMLPMTKRTELSRLFKPILYHPKQTVCSSAHFADRVVIVVEGVVRFQDGRVWECGEAAGYTCVVPHRWAQTATAVTSSKLIELRHHEYRDFLGRHDVLEQMKTAALALMFPKASNPEQVYWALLATQKLRNPPMYPMSQSEVINPCEERFGIKVMSFGQQKVHRRGAQPQPSALEADVNASLQRIDDRVRRMQMARNYAPLSKQQQKQQAQQRSSTSASAVGGGDQTHVRSHSSMSQSDHASSAGCSRVSSSWSRSRLLLIKTEFSSDAPLAARNVENHPYMREYRENHRRPVAFRRPWSSLSTLSSSGISEPAPAGVMQQTTGGPLEAMLSSRSTAGGRQGSVAQ